jgi:hypothetical protein
MEILFSKLSLEDKSNSIDDINVRISKEICFYTIEKLKDANLLDEFKKCKSTISEVEKLEKVLIKNEISNEKIKEIINDYILELIPPGTKGVIRGNLFNKLIKEYILKLDFLQNEDYEIQFEKKSDFYKTSEIPDWYIYNKTNNKILIGMNQLDLWSGGHQINRGFKYIVDCKNEENKKLICLICNEVKLKSNKNKVYKIFEKGFENNSLCYIKNLNSIIKDYFDIP